MQPRFCRQSYPTTPLQKLFISLAQVPRLVPNREGCGLTCPSWLRRRLQYMYDFPRCSAAVICRALRDLDAINDASTAVDYTMISYWNFQGRQYQTCVTGCNPVTSSHYDVSSTTASAPGDQCSSFDSKHDDGGCLRGAV